MLTGGGDGEIDSSELLRARLRRVGDTDSRLPLGRAADGDNAGSLNLARRTGGGVPVSSRYRVPRSVIPVGIGGDLEPSLYMGGVV